MAFKLRYTEAARADLRQLANYLADYSPAISKRIMSDLATAVHSHILPSPGTWQFFFLTGAPYRAYLYRISRHTAYWIVYRIDESDEAVVIMRCWNASREPHSFEVL